MRAGADFEHGGHDLSEAQKRKFLSKTKFTRDDFASSLRIFSMQQISNPIYRSELIESLVPGDVHYVIILPIK
ncbi:MAG: hypothetical protein A2170_02700 [Deltaproteobacteria bacterium RBG_13_53_10]|nr:MAG: hypothetical protein A2170_02700 [Deltaproteobacteria bacterium RBG_13_53_10]